MVDMLPTIKSEPTSVAPAACDAQPATIFNDEQETERHVRPHRDRIVISGALLLLLLGTLTVLILVFHPFAGPSGGCGGG
jgi:hypothetical protein